MGLAEEILKKERGGGEESPKPRASSFALKDLYRAIKNEGLTEEQFERKFRASVKAMLAED